VTPGAAGTGAACGAGAATPGSVRSGGRAIGAVDTALALYVHMPWCVRKCPYCDFNSHQLKSAAPDRGYIDALIRDFDAELPLVASRRIDTVFFGGGTPSLFAPEDFARLLRSLRQRIAFASDAEITLEANPGTIERGRFAGYREAGINRVSLGAQTFTARALERLGRIHTADDTHRAVEELRSAGIQNFNLDLMYALPEQTLEEAIADVRIACALNPTHISYYQLTLEPGTVFHARPPPLPDDEAAWHIQLECQRLLAAAGYRQYEVSAYAREGFRCRHNLNYWLFGDYLGIGAGAHGKLSLELPEKILRTAKPKQPREFQERVTRAQGGEHAQGGGHAQGGERNFVVIADLPFEFMLNALRLNEGFSNDCFEVRTGLPAEAFSAAMHSARTRGLVEATHNGWKPTDLGRRFLNDLQTSFLA
jgi:putative oxygen-independent coproporphyrinogen III oxidase